MYRDDGPRKMYMERSKDSITLEEKRERDIKLLLLILSPLPFTSRTAYIHFSLTILATSHLTAPGNHKRLGNNV